ncbi:hypothetical protein JG688_00018003 [Phytophthora aleatoria]|uniref:Protein kinase domain-containing protein n=1 Tax=Phytophthora aleatoria TaxID=2496075 RepID=A0A8J5IS02_9STRA|nr:hypothetical protein JG688_00018003 [Phytophthora aleatoria]
MDTASKMMSSAHAHGQDTCSKDPAGCMRAIVWTGKSVKLEHIPKPKIMEASDVVVKVTTCSVSPDFATDVCFEKMDPFLSLNDTKYFGDFHPAGGQVHVLVVPSEGASGAEVWNMERDAKRRKVEENVSLNMLWRYSEMKMTALPLLHELSTLLQRPLPFQVEVLNFSKMKPIFDPSGPFLVCKELTSLIDHFSIACDYRPEPMASENTWQRLYDQLLDIPTFLCKAYGFGVSSSRNRVDTAGTTAKGMRPDFILHYLGMVLLRGEEKSAATDVDVPCKELTKKMYTWNPMFYGDLPYILGYATSGERLRVVMIDRHLHANTILEFPSIFQQPAEVIKMFYNLAFFFHKMTILSKRTCPSPLMPFTPDVNGKRKIELMDEMIIRTIKREQCRDDVDFERLADIYATLQDLDKRVHVRTHLQTVRKLDVKKGLLRVHLSPLGHVRSPEDVDEVRDWLRCMLTALKYWHSCNYCHGDLRWSNIVHIPASDSGYWVLIDMDESRKPNTTTIDWNHKFRGHKLIFQHDLYQLGQLMKTLLFPLPDDLVGIQKVLLSAVDTPAFTAEVELTTLLLDQLHH